MYAGKKSAVYYLRSIDYPSIIKIGVSKRGVIERKHDKEADIGGFELEIIGARFHDSEAAAREDEAWTHKHFADNRITQEGLSEYFNGIVPIDIVPFVARLWLETEWFFDEGKIMKEYCIAGEFLKILKGAA